MIDKYSNNDVEFINESLKEFASNIDLSSIKGNPFSDIYTFTDNDRCIGFVVLSRYYERLEIDYIYVSKECRNQGIATKLLAYVINQYYDCNNITLEVNIHNEAAINLYKKVGFNIVSLREKYYPDGTPAYLMEKKFENIDD